MRGKTYLNNFSLRYVWFSNLSLYSAYPLIQVVQWLVVSESVIFFFIFGTDLDFSRKGKKKSLMVLDQVYKEGGQVL